jgi:Fe-S-cluster containining protein
MTEADGTHSWRPLRRAELVLSPPRDDGVVPLRDPLLEREIQLGPVGSAIFARLDGQHAVEAILSEVRSLAPERTPAEVERSFRSLLLLDLVEGAGDAVRAKLRAVRARSEHEMFALPGARFACQGIGDCCQSYLLGPLQKRDVAVIEQLDVRAKMPHLPPGPYVETLEVQGKSETFLKRVDERCVFLLEDGRCGIHAHFGPEKKPFVCRIFPYEVALTYEGLRVADMGECSTFAVSATLGPPATEIAKDATSVLPGRFVLQHPIINLGELGCDYGHVAPVVNELVALASRPEPAVAATLASVGETLRQLKDELESCALARGEPDATVERIVARAKEAPLRPAAPAAHRSTVLAAGELLGVLIPRVVEAKLLPRQILSAAQQRELSELLFFLRSLAARAASSDPTPLDPYLARALAVPLEPASEAALKLSIRQQLFSGRIFIRDRLAPGLLRLSLALVLAVLGGKLRALARGATAVHPLDLSWAHHMAQRGLRARGCEDALIREEKLAWDACASAAALLAAMRE